MEECKKWLCDMNALTRQKPHFGHGELEGALFFAQSLLAERWCDPCLHGQTWHEAILGGEDVG